MRKIFVVMLVIIVCGTFTALYPLWVLFLSIDNEIIYFRIVKPHDFFHLGYLHSVELTDVWDRFTIDSEHRIILTETKFQGQGAGLPINISGNERLERDGKWFRITEMNRLVPFLYWRVGEKWHNRFRYLNGEEQDISSLTGNALVLVRVEKIRTFNWLLYYISSRIL